MALLDPITNAPRNQKVVLGVFASVIVAALGYFLLLSPKQTERDALRAQSEQVRAELMQAQALEASVRGFKAQAEALRKRLEAASERISRSSPVSPWPCSLREHPRRRRSSSTSRSP
jgi:Tfp pilus assembly protein PilO